MKRLKALLVALGVLPFALFVPSPAQANVPLTQISSDPFSNPTSQHATEVEPDTFAFGSTVVAAFQTGRFVSGGGASDIGWATSTNGGASWTHGFLPLTKFSGGPFDRLSDPVVAYDARDGVWLISALDVPDSAVFPVGTPAAVVSRSTDGGFTWSSPVTVASVSSRGHIGHFGFPDKPWVVCDNTPASSFYGHCYDEWDEFPGEQVEMNTSTDGGLTWGPSLTPANGVPGFGGQPLVQPGGTVIVPIAHSPAGDPNLSIYSFRSDDGGASWSRMTLVSLVKAHTPAGGLRAVPLPSAEIDAAGRVYVSWQDCRFRSKCSSNDIVFATSADGVSWSPVTRVPIDPVTSTVDHFIPGLAVDRATSGTGAHLGLTYYFYPDANCDFANCQLDVGFISSTNGGASWSAPTQLTGPMSLSWIADTSAGRMVGDYISTSFTADGLAHGVFAVANPPSGGLFEEAMHTTANGLPAIGGTAVASPGGVVFTGTTSQSPPPPNH